LPITVHMPIHNRQLSCRCSMSLYGPFLCSVASCLLVG